MMGTQCLSRLCQLMVIFLPAEQMITLILDVKSGAAEFIDSEWPPAFSDALLPKDNAASILQLDA